MGGGKGEVDFEGEEVVGGREEERGQRERKKGRRTSVLSSRRGEESTASEGGEGWVD